MPVEREGLRLIRAGRVIDGLGGRPLENGAVLIDGSKIAAVGPSGNIVAPEGARVEVYDYPGRTVMPGMVDCHTHLNGLGCGFDGEDLGALPDEVLTLQSARNARACLFSGMTSVRDNGAKNSTTFHLRDAVTQGVAVGPRMVLCGRPITIIGGHMGYFGSEASGSVGVRAMTRTLIGEGADYIKICATGGGTRTSLPLRPSFNVDELRAITEEAHACDKLTATHCHSTQGIINSLDADVDMIIHCWFKDADGTDTFREDVAERIGVKGAYVNPTLHAERAMPWALQRKKERHGLTPREQALLDSTLRDFEVRLEHCSRLIDMGLKIITGSDASWGDYQLGNTVYEVECLAKAGYSAMEALLSVTSEAAKSLGIDSITGTLEPGKQADIVVIDGDPTVRVSDLWNVTDVFLAGQQVDRGSSKSLAALRQWPPDSELRS